MYVIMVERNNKLLGTNDLKKSKDVEINTILLVAFLGL
jgi:hypothetical protein